ncbi:energy transducer TonB [Azospirillum sp. A1-3]|uniref:energy transducer TonB n=1 Tax=Azospirillum sp. A1-3 TaxID=185874 RepID=UPI002077046F|nr:energy transducer TonB [Azospirillum sp. A1-3]MCM8738156.1 energy transducer TonB [Azospirillum sp. A1-3]
MSAAFDQEAVGGWSADGAERPERGAFRWGGSLMLALGVHAAAGVAMVAWHVPITPSEVEPPAVLLELAPLPVAPPEPAPAIDIPLPEPMPESVIEPEREPPPPEPVVEEPPPEPPPVVEPEVVLPKPPPELPKPIPKPDRPKPDRPKPEKPKLEKPKPPRPVAQPVQPVPVAAPPAPTPAPAPAATAPSAAPSRAVPSWQGRLLSHLERHKRYPRAAQTRRQEGVTQVRFTIDRDGNVLSVRLDRSSGVPSLDEETVEMVRRASPLPAPPEEMAKDRIELVVPVQFFIR